MASAKWHCVAPPTILDARRSALFIRYLFESPHVRIIGVDGEAAGPILRAVARECAAGAIAARRVRPRRLDYETSNDGRLWFYGHHNHMHVSWRD